MHAASRESLRLAQERLDERLAASASAASGAASGAEADLDALAGELFALSALLDREFVLRRALSDPGAPAEARRRLFDRVLGGQLRPDTVEELHELVGAHWSRPGDLSDALETLARQATLAVAERAGALDEVQDELFRFGRILDGQPDLRRLLTDPGADIERRIGLLDGLIEGKVHAATRRLLDETVRHPRGTAIETALERLVELAASRRQRYLAFVRAAAPLTEAQQDRLAATLSRLYGRSIDLEIEIEPELIGGLVIRVNDEVIDGSVAHRLAAVRQQLAG
jgi:F-type H+-transporting ATPase subunit delta